MTRPRTDRRTVDVVPSGAAPPALLEEVHALLLSAFDDFGGDDWAHTLGGHHVVVRGPDVVAHAAVVPRLLTVGGRPVRTGYVEGVATAPASQRQGAGSLAMEHVARVLHGHFEMGALSTGRHAFYERLGWRRWHGPTFVRHGSALVRTPDEDDGVMVLTYGASADVALDAPIACDARPGDDW